jgi:DNA-directed RNA polymerase II subunit RPB2
MSNLTNETVVKEGIDRLIELYFSQPQILYSHLFSSYHQLVEEIIPYTLKEEAGYFYENVTPKEIFNYGFKFDDIKIFPPIRERDNEMVYPHMARKNHLNYFANIQAKVTQFQERIDLLTGEKTIRNIGDPETAIVGAIPVMVKSRYCTTYLKPETSKYECKYDPGGYFIVGGQEKVVVSIEKQVDNKILVFSSNDSSYPGGKVFKVQFNSRKHDWSDNLQIINIRNLKDNSLVITTSQFVDVPMVIILRALGVESDEELVERITNNLEDIPMVNLIRNSLEQSKDDEGKPIKTRDEAIEYLITKLKNNRRIIQTDEKIAKEQKKLYLDKIFRKDLLPHLGEDIPTKICFFCLMLKQLLEVMLKRRDEDDRDAFDNKRVETPGILLGQLFRQNFKKMLNEISKLFRKKNSSDETPVNMVSQIKPTIIEQGIKTGLATGIWGLSKTKKGVAQSLSRLTYLQTISYLRRIKSPSLETSTSKITSIRHVNNIQAFYICNVETPEGQQIGLVKSLSMMATVTPNYENQKQLLTDIIVNNPKIQHPFLINPSSMENYIKIFLNGAWKGCIEVHEGVDFYQNLRDLRRQGKINKFVTITMDYFKKEIKILTESGRLIRPLIKVEDNQVKITSSMVADFNKELTGEKKETGWNRILLKYPELIDYEDMEGSMNLLIAMDRNFLKESRDNATRKVDKSEVIKANRYGPYRYMKYTHTEFHPALMLGTIVPIVPFINHNPSNREIIFHSQAKQTIGIYATNYKDRMDISNILYHPQIPLVTTRLMKYNRFMDLPSGENAIVAVLCYTGLTVSPSHF